MLCLGFLNVRPQIGWCWLFRGAPFNTAFPAFDLRLAGFRMLSEGGLRDVPFWFWVPFDVTLDGAWTFRRSSLQTHI